MSTNITPVYTAILSQLGTLFPSPKTRIPNPYSLPDNMDQFLENGWGLKVGPGVPANLFEFCSQLFDHTFTVVFTRRLEKLDTETTEIDALTLAMLEDVVAVQNLFYATSELGIPANIVKVDISDRSGFTQAKAEKFSFISFEQNFTFSIQETIA